MGRMGTDALAELPGGASEFSRLTPTVWGPAGQALAFQMRLCPGEAVLDVWCGAGASALPAATAVGPAGLVHAVDVDDDLLEQGRVLASERALGNIDFVRADPLKWEPPSSVPRRGYDALACSYTLLSVPHPNLAVARLVRLLRPVARVGVTVWRRGALGELTDTLRDAVAAHTPDRPAARATGPQRLDDPDDLRAWLTGHGAGSVEVNELSNLLPATDDLVWDLVLGSALRSSLPSDPGVVAAVRAEFLGLLTARGVTTVDAGTLVATAVVVH